MYGTEQPLQRDPNRCIGSQVGGGQAQVPDPHASWVSLNAWCLAPPIKAVRKSTRTAAETLAPQFSLYGELQVFPGGRVIPHPGLPQLAGVRIPWACGGQGIANQNAGWPVKLGFPRDNQERCVV